jgi:hypothetical protein
VPRLRASWIAVAAIGLAISGCGGGNEPRPESKGEAQIREVVSGLSSAAANRDGKAFCSYLTKGMKHAYEKWIGDCAHLLAPGGTPTGGGRTVQKQLGSVVVQDVSVKGRRANVTFAGSELTVGLEKVGDDGWQISRLFFAPPEAPP